MITPIKFVGLTAETSALVETFRERPDQVEDEIINRALKQIRSQEGTAPQPRQASLAAAPSPVRQGCDLGEGVCLEQGERIYCWLRKRDIGKQEPDGVAVARDGALFIDDRRVEPQRGAWLQAALKLIQNRVGDISETTGDAKSLNAWIKWFVVREGKPITVGDLRPTVRRRGSTGVALTLEDLGL